MPVSTTLKLPQELKSRIADAAQAAGETPHAFMVEAIELQTALYERRRGFLADALSPREEVAQYGPGPRRRRGPELSESTSRRTQSRAAA